MLLACCVHNNHTAGCLCLGVIPKESLPPVEGIYGWHLWVQRFSPASSATLNWSSTPGRHHDSNVNLFLKPSFWKEGKYCGHKEGRCFGPHINVNKVSEGWEEALAEATLECACRTGFTFQQGSQAPGTSWSPCGSMRPSVVLESGPYPWYLAFPVCILPSIYSPNMYWGTRLDTREAKVSVIGCLLWGAASFKLQMMKIWNSVGARTLLEVAGTCFIVPRVEQIGGLSLSLII